jgi:hypothetical protein
MLCTVTLSSVHLRLYKIMFAVFVTDEDKLYMCKRVFGLIYLICDSKETGIDQLRQSLRNK